jgi:hypothetical protein
LVLEPGKGVGWEEGGLGWLTGAAGQEEELPMFCVTVGQLWLTATNCGFGFGVLSTQSSDLCLSGEELAQPGGHRTSCTCMEISHCPPHMCNCHASTKFIKIKFKKLKFCCPESTPVILTAARGDTSCCSKSTPGRGIFFRFFFFCSSGV